MTIGPLMPHLSDDVLNTELARCKGIFHNRGPAPRGNDAATCAQALLVAIRLCNRNNKPIPGWIGRALSDAYERVEAGYEKTLDAALGLKRPNKAERTARRLDPRTGLTAAALIVLEVHGRHHRYKSSIDEGLFESVGRPLFLSASTVRDIYYASRKCPKVLRELEAFVAKMRLGNTNPDVDEELETFFMLPGKHQTT